MRMRKSFLDRYEVHDVGGRALQEYWIPAEEFAAGGISRPRSPGRISASQPREKRARGLLRDVQQGDVVRCAQLSCLELAERLPAAELSARIFARR